MRSEHQRTSSSFVPALELAEDPTPQQVERLRAVYQLTDGLTRADDLESIYQAALHALRRTLFTDRAAILLYEPDGVMRFQAWHGLSDAYRAAVEGHSPWRRDDPDPREILVPDVQLDASLAAYRDVIAGEGIRALGFIPLVARERLMGKFMLYFDQPHPFAAEEIQLAQTIAGHVALAVERKQAADKLALYRSIFAHSSEAIAIVDLAGKYIEQNAAHRRMVEYEDDELIDRTPAIHLGDETFRRVARVLDVDGVFNEDVVSTNKSGERRDLELSAFTVRDDDGDPVCYVGIQHDITARKWTTQSLQFLAGASKSLDRSLEYESTLHEIAHLAVPRLADWVIVEVVDGDAVHRVGSVHEDPQRSRMLEQLLAARRASGSSSLGGEGIRSGVTREIANPFSHFVQELGPSAETAALLQGLGMRSAIMVPLKARGHVLGAVTLGSSSRTYRARDIALAEDFAHRGATALDNARLYREAQESNRRKEEFLAVLGHELRNPLSPLVTSLEILRLTQDPQTFTVQRESMERQVRNLKRLVDDLLDVSRITRGKIELQTAPVELATIVAQAVETIRPLFDRVGLSVDVAPGLWIEADTMRLEQVLVNLLHNASKYTLAGGHVDVVGHRESHEAVVRVRDNGKGISATMLPHVFELFVQGESAGDEKKAGGLGIGLTLARALIELHGGTIAASSSGPGGGSEFVVRLPLRPGSGDEAMRSGTSQAVPRFGNESNAPRTPVSALIHARVAPRRVIVVDDNVDAARVLADLLEIRGHRVVAVHDGRSAIDEALNARPDVMLLDIGLPDIDGYDLAARIRSHPELEHTQLVAISGYGQSRPGPSEFSQYLVKPVALSQLADLGL